MEAVTKEKWVTIAVEEATRKGRVWTRGAMCMVVLYMLAVA